MTRAALLLALLFAACGEPVAPAPDAGVDAGPVDGGEWSRCYDEAHPEKGVPLSGECSPGYKCACPNVCTTDGEPCPGTSRTCWRCTVPR